MKKEVNTVKQLQKFMKADDYEYDALDIEMLDGDLVLRFNVSTDKQVMMCKTSSNCSAWPVDCIKKFRGDEYETIDNFLDMLEKKESFKTFVKNTFGVLYNRKVEVSGFGLCEKNNNGYEYIGMAIYNFDTKKIDFIEE